MVEIPPGGDLGEDGGRGLDDGFAATCPSSLRSPEPVPVSAHSGDGQAYERELAEAISIVRDFLESITSCDKCRGNTLHIDHMEMLALRDRARALLKARGEA